MRNTQSLIVDATNHLNGRVNGRSARLARLSDAGVPTEDAAMRSWLNATLDAQHESGKGVFHCCTARVSNGVDPDLPQQNKIGCRIVRVPVKASLVTHDADGTEIDPPHWSVRFGVVGPGFLIPAQVSLDSAATEEEAENLIRSRLLSSGECVSTRSEAVNLVTRMLAERVARK